MTTPFDAAGKDLIELGPADWLAHLGQPRPAEIVRLIDADLSATVTTVTDKVIRVDDADPWLALVELQASWDGGLPFDLLRRYALLRHRHRLPVSCAVVLLRPEANTSAMTGAFAQPDPLGRDWAFPFRVIRVWEQPAETYLRGPLALLPLAPVTAVDPDAARPLISEVRGRLGREAGRAQAERLWEATSVLLALRFRAGDLERLRDLMASLDLMDTDFARIAMEEGELRGARTMVLELGAEKFGPPPPEVETAVRSIRDAARLHQLNKRVLRAASWQDLLAE